MSSPIMFSDNIVPRWYSINFYFKDVNGSFTGATIIEGTVVNDTDIFDFHFDEHGDKRKVDYVDVFASYSGKYYGPNTTNQYHRSQGFYRSKFEQTVPAGADIRLTIQFHNVIGENVDDTHYGGVVFGDGAKKMVIGNGYKVRQMYPCIDLAKYRVPMTLIVYRNRFLETKVFSNTEVMEEKSVRRGKRTKFMPTKPMDCRGLGFCIVTKATLYERHEDSPSVPKLSFYSTVDKNVDDTFSVVQKTLHWDRLTVPIIDDKLDIFIIDAEKPHDYVAPLSFVGLVFYRSDILVDWRDPGTGSSPFNPEMNTFRLVWGLTQIYLLQMCGCGPHDTPTQWLRNGLSMFLAEVVSKELFADRDYGQFENMIQYRFVREVMAMDNPSSSHDHKSMGSSENNTEFTVHKAIAFIRHLAFWNRTQTSPEDMEDMFCDGIFALINEYKFTDRFYTFQDVLDRVFPKMTVSAKDLNSWITQPFFPEVHANLNANTGEISLTQLCVPGEHQTIDTSGYQWRNPIMVVMRITNRVVYWTELVFDQQIEPTYNVTKRDIGNDFDSWQFNHRGDAYYEVFYDDTLLQRLLSAYQEKFIPEAERFRIVLALTNQIPRRFDQRKELLRALFDVPDISNEYETSALVWNELHNYLAMASFMDNFNPEFADIVRPCITEYEANPQFWHRSQYRDNQIKRIFAQIHSMIGFGLPFGELFDKHLNGKELTEEEMNIKEATFEWRGRWGGEEGVADLKTIYERSTDHKEKMLCLQSMVLSLEENALEESFGFALKEAEKMKNIEAVLKSAAKNRQGVGYAKRYLEDHKLTEVEALFVKFTLNV